MRAGPLLECKRRRGWQAGGSHREAEEACCEEGQGRSRQPEQGETRGGAGSPSKERDREEQAAASVHAESDTQKKGDEDSSQAMG